MNNNDLNEAEHKDEPIELTELFVQKRKTVTFSDTVTVQAIFCVAAAIVFVVINIINTDLAYDIYSIYSEKSASESSISDIFRIIIEFFRSAHISINV